MKTMVRAVAKAGIVQSAMLAVGAALVLGTAVAGVAGAADVDGAEATPSQGRGGLSAADRAVDRLFAAYRSGSVEGMLAVYAQDAVFEDVAQRHLVEGAEALRAMLGGLVAMHHRVDLVEKRRLADGHVVVVEYEYTGQLDGAAVGQAVGKTGCPDLEYSLPATSWYEVRDGRITRQRDFIDLATFMEIRERMLAAGSAPSGS